MEQPSREPSPGHHATEAPSTPVVGVAPLALAPPTKPRLRRTQRYVTAAVVTGTLATVPLSSLTATARPVPEDAVAAEAFLGPEQRPAPPAGPAQAATASAAEARREPTAQIADAGGVEVVEPSTETELVGFHESLNAAALALTPTDTLEADHSTKRVPRPEAGGDDDEAGATSIVLPTRNRAAAATSAIDIAVPAGERVVSPVSGEVVAVTPYFLYGEHPDVRIDVVPRGHPDLRVVIIHVSGVGVEVGDELKAGRTPIARSAAVFPFESQIDRFVDEQRAPRERGAPTPHIHVEVYRVG